MVRKPIAAAFVLLIAQFGLAACEDIPPSDPTPVPIPSIYGSAWHADSVNGMLFDLPRPTLRFHAGGRLTGQAPCNSYSASFDLGLNTLVIGPVVATRKACTPPLMEREAAFFAMLQSTNSYFTSPGEWLMLRGPDDVMNAKR